MRIITISREFGSGGRELGKRIADYLGYDYYDKEIISTIAKNMGMDEQYVEKALESSDFHSIPLHYRVSFAGGMALPLPQTEMLLEQKKVIEAIAKAGKNCVIVGRNADAILEGYKPFNIFVCATMDAKVNRCLEHMQAGDPKTRKEMEKKIISIDKGRALTRDLITGSKWGEKSNYHAVLNTTDWNVKELVPAAANLAECWFKSQGK